jgi:predicted dehydrogenase
VTRVPRFRAGIIGCGRKGLTIDDERKCPTNYSEPPSSHALALASMPQMSLVAAADPDPDARERLQARFRDVRAYESYEEMLVAEQLDIVTVATHTPLHAPAVIAAARAGARAIVCEKAMATSAAEAHAMIRACRESGTVLVVDHPRRYHPTYVGAREAILSGAIGELRLINAMAVNGMIHNGTHFFDLFRFFMGEASAVSGHVEPRADGDGDGWARVEFNDGRSAILDATSPVEAGIELLGERGKIEIDGAFSGYVMTTYQQSKAPEDPSASAWFHGRPCRSRRTRRYAVTPTTGTLVALLQDTLDCLSSDRSPRSSGYDGAAALELALGAFASSSRGGAIVPLPLQDLALRVVSR